MFWDFLGNVGVGVLGLCVGFGLVGRNGVLELFGFFLRIFLEMLYGCFLNILFREVGELGVFGVF